MLELCKDLTGAYLRQPNHKKRVLIKLLCSNLFYDGSKLTITIKEPFKALMNFAVFKSGAGNGLISEPFKELLNEFDSSESMGIFYRINLLKIA